MYGIRKRTFSSCVRDIDHRYETHKCPILSSETNNDIWDIYGSIDILK